MRNLAKVAAMAIMATTGVAQAGDDAPSFVFPSIDGGSYNTADWRGMPVLVVNTASMCGFTPQYEGLQVLSDQYKGRAVVLTVPSDDFNQELASDAEVKEFCALNYALDLPMTTIEHVAKGSVHPLFAWLRDSQGYVPDWNFNKVLLGADGAYIAAWGSGTKPMSATITDAMDQALLAR
jgi:glutathione peroxidase